MINKFLLIPKVHVDSTTIANSKLATLVKEGPLSVAPAAWPEEAGITHYGYKFSLTLKELEIFIESVSQFKSINILGYSDTDDNDKILSQVGMRVHPSA